MGKIVMVTCHILMLHKNAFLQEQALGPVLFTSSTDVCITFMKGTNSIEPGRTAHKSEKNKNNLVPSEIKSSKFIKPRL